MERHGLTWFKLQQGTKVASCVRKHLNHLFFSKTNDILDNQSKDFFYVAILNYAILVNLFP